MAFKRVGDALETGARLLAARLSENLTSRGSVASGELGASIEVKTPSPRGGTYSTNVYMNDYWEFVDEGRKPGKRPPIQPILKWLSYPAVQDRMTFGRGAMMDTNLESIAYLIAAKIGREGTKGNHFATDVFNSDLPDDIEKLIIEAAEEDFDELIEELQRLADT